MIDDRDDDYSTLDRVQDLGAWILFLGLPVLLIATAVWLFGWY